jgi:predicted AlkP superfamily phosphohydrolase/phosphomutase/tetratricopeptide (TPR) repeat protein
MTAKRIAKRILLIGWDAADWEHINPLLDAGKLPGLEALINRGVMGNLATLHPVLSPMLWNSISTGKTADKHGILGFTEPAAAGAGIRPFASTSRKAKAIWNICHQNGLRSNVVAWWASHPAEPIHGAMVSNLFNGIRRKPDGSLAVTPGTIHPAERVEELGRLKIFADEITQDDVLPFIPKAIKIDQSKDPRLATLCKLLSDCASIQAVTTQLLVDGPWDLTAVYFDAIDHFCHAFMPYHPPKMKNVTDEDFEIYSNLVTGAYQFHDMLLERLVRLAGDDATIVICSDHGFQSRHLRPFATPLEPTGPAAWHRNLGIVIMAGPGIKQDERIYGANLIDITPTILYQLGLPVGEDMDGRVLLDAFEDPRRPEVIPSWEDVPGECGKHPIGAEAAGLESPSSAGNDLIKQFVALGYIADPGDDLEKATRDCQLELDYNLARVYLSTDRFEQAAEMLVSLVQAAAWEDRYWKNLAACYFELGYYRQAQKIMASLYRDMERPPVFALVFLARTCLALNETDRAEDYLRSAMALNPTQPTIHITAGRIWLRMGRLEQAEEAFRKSLASDPDNAHAFLGLAGLYLHMKRYDEAAEAAVSAVTTVYRLPHAHWILGMALLRMRDWERAKLPFETLLRFRNERYEMAARRCLARICREMGLDTEADLHAIHAREIRPVRRQRQVTANRNRETLVDLPEIPAVKERRQTHQTERPQRQRGPGPGEKRQQSGRTLTIVSGLPRSGTSLMMQMLQAAGLPAKTDGQRQADENNPEGYFEWEEIKRLPRQPDLLDDQDLEGKAIKVISMLLPALPRRHRYKVIFMNRPADEVAASQHRMIERLGGPGTCITVEDMARQLREHREQVEQWLAQQRNFELLMVDYPELIVHPAAQAQRVVEFLGTKLLPYGERMSQVVRPELYRTRSQ